MSGMLLRMGDRANTNIMEFCVDSKDEIDYLPTTTRKGTGIFSNNTMFDFIAPIGSTCTVGNEDGNVLVYMLFSFGWKEL